MKLFLILALALSATQASAAVKFEGRGWAYGSAEPLVVEKVGIAASSSETIRVVLNFSEGRQVILTDKHVALGLSLTSFQGKCIKVMPGQRFESVNFILSCE